MITLPLFQETHWDITPPSKNRLCKSLNDTTKYQSSKLLMIYKFYRNYPALQQSVSHKIYSPLNETAEIFHQMICEKKAAVFAQNNFYGSLIRLASAGTMITPYVFKIEEFHNDIFMRLHPSDGNSSYWEVGNNFYKGNQKGITFFAISDPYSPVTFNFSVLTFYISVVYLIARFLRYFVAGGSKNIYMTDMKNPGPLITLCAGVYVSRMRGDMGKEEELYYELIDILRSPELVKSMTGSSSIKDKID